MFEILPDWVHLVYTTAHHTHLLSEPFLISRCDKIECLWPSDVLKENVEFLNMHKPFRWKEPILRGLDRPNHFYKTVQSSSPPEKAKTSSLGAEDVFIQMHTKSSGKEWI